MDYLKVSLNDVIHQGNKSLSKEEHLKVLILKVSRLSYTVCNEFIGWDFIRESTNAQEFLKDLSDELEELLFEAFMSIETLNDDETFPERLRFLIKASKSIIFSFAFTSVSDADVRKNFVSFQKEILPYLVKAAL
jgi:hypothetical protein